MDGRWAVNYIGDKPPDSGLHDGLPYSNSKSLDSEFTLKDKSQHEVAKWGTLVHGVDEHDGWVRTRKLNIAIMDSTKVQYMCVGNRSLRLDSERKVFLGP